MAYIAMAYIGTAHIVKAYIVKAYAVVADCAVGRQQELGRSLAAGSCVACAEAVADPAAGGGDKPLEEAHEPRPHQREHPAVLAAHHRRHALVCGLMQLWSI